MRYPRHTADRGISRPPPPPPSFPLLLRDFFLHPLDLLSLQPLLVLRRRRLLFLLVFFLSFSLLYSVAAPLPPPYPPRRDDDQTSAITLLLFASPPLLFLVLFRLRSFCSYLPFAKTSTRYRRRGKRALIAASIRSDALGRRVNLSQRSLIRAQGGCDKEFIPSSFPFFSLFLSQRVLHFASFERI